MTITFTENLAPNADLKTVVETCAKEIAEETRSALCQICLSNSLDPATSLIYEFRTAPNGSAQTGEHKLILPLMNQGELLGTITVAGSQQQDPDVAGQLSAALAQLAVRIHKAQTADVVQRQTFHKTFLTEIDNVMSYSMGVGDALFVIVNILGKVLKASRCVFVCTDDSQTGWKSYEYWVQDQVQSCRSFGWPPTDSVLVAQSLLTKEPVMIHAASAGTFFTPAQQELQLLGVQSFLGIPLKNENGVYGCVMLQQCDFRRRWKHADIDMLQAAADMVAKGFLNVSAEKFAREPIMQLHQQNINSYKDQKVGQKKVEAVRRALKSTRRQNEVQKEPVPVAPAKTHSKKQASPRTPDEEYIYGTARLDTRTLDRIAGWISRVEANDKYANGHAVPVAKYAVATAEQLKLEADEVSTMRVAALVHDVGKMGISDYILQREEEDLSDAELLITMRHPQDGAELLESFPDLAYVAPIVLAHHEEYDGNGFPFGTQGEDIPLMARILFAANSYHTMISARKSGFTPVTPQVAQENLRHGAGTQYDPRVVEALLRVLKREQG
jgi:putative nucleotidyltransferase with HDIG domain